MDDLFGLSDAAKDHLRHVLAVGEVGVWELDIDTGQAWRNRRHDQIFGYPDLLTEWTYERFLGHVVDEDKETVDALFAAALKGGEMWSFECRINRADGQERWLSAHGQPLKDDTGRTRKLIGHVVDITHTKKNEERLRLITAELNHRVRNMLAVLTAMVKFSAKSASSVEELEAALSGRLSALARTHDLFVNFDGRPVTVSEVIRAEFAPFGVAPGRVRITGDAGLTLTGKTVESFALIVHELITNAMKHGALSNESGGIDISLTQLPDRKVRVSWRESGGPRVEPPRRTGFGSILLRTILGEDGSVSTEYRTTGLVSTIELDATPGKPALAETAESPAAAALGSLSGKRIMIVEDEALIALALKTVLAEEDAIVSGPFATPESALDALDTGVDAAVLDVSLGQTTSRAVAERLRAMGIPFLFMTGYGEEHSLGSEFSHAPVLKKPVADDTVLRALKQLLHDG